MPLLGCRVGESQVMGLVWFCTLSLAWSSYFNGCLSRVWLWRLWSRGNAMAFDFYLKKRKKAVCQTFQVTEITLSQLKITSGKPRFGESKRGLTLAGALRWNRDSYRAGHWPWTTENFSFFSFSFFFFFQTRRPGFSFSRKGSSAETVVQQDYFTKHIKQWNEVQ